MKNEFDFKRFGLLFIKDLRSIKATFGTTLLIIILLPLAVWLFTISLDSNDGISPFFRWVLLEQCMMLAAILAPSRIYKHCNTQNLGIHFAMLPASKKEKFWSMVLTTAIVIPFMVLCGGLLLDIILRVLPFGSYHEWIFAESPIRLIPFPIMILSLFMASSLFFFTSTLFKKHKVTKTILWSMLIFFIISLFVPILLENIIDDILPTNMMSLSADEAYRTTYIVILILQSLWTAAFYCAAYYRLKNMKY